MEPVSVHIPMKLGETEITIHLYEKEGLDITFVHLHGDEPTAHDAAIETVDAIGGRVLRFIHADKRFIEFELEGVRYSFDPNRMFTSKGIKETLHTTNKYTDVGNYSHAAHLLVAEFAREIKKQFLFRAKGIVAVHNNSDGDYHAGFYAPGGKFAHEALSYNLKDGTPKENFFFVTDADHFCDLVDSGCNAVLQDNAAATDDGSLSVFCAQQRIPYINCEAEIGHHDAQVDMLIKAAWLLAGEK